eukprot:TRINITY_DN15351_c0_g1_i1.p1 TRINITY_DN15351_c0_g1~~TRINITY_DN15351_c0_g1_i1.p1  ORF type:complete len:160 (-),score=28.19 TRINITY_DN15351_c0_g1_i1:192-671(-)
MFMMKKLNEIILQNSSGVVTFPSDLLFSPTPNRPWQWQDFEVFYAYYQVLINNSLVEVDSMLIRDESSRLAAAQYSRDIKPTETVITDSTYDIEARKNTLNRLKNQEQKRLICELFPGACGSGPLLKKEVIVKTRTLQWEKYKFLLSETSKTWVETVVY